MTKEQREALLKKAREHRPQLFEGKDIANMSDDEVLEVAQMAMEPQKEDEEKKKKGKEETPDDKDAKQSSDATETVDMKTMQDVLKEFEARAKCERLLDKTLDGETTLPDLAKSRVREKFDGKIFRADELTAAVKSEKEYLAKMSVPGFENIGDQSRANVGPGTLEKIRMGVDLMFGLGEEDVKTLAKARTLHGERIFPNITVKQAENYGDADPFHGIGELYATLTGDTAMENRFFPSRLSAELRAAQGLDSGTFSYVLGDSMYRRLMKDYTAPNFRENLLISNRKSVKDFRNQEIINVGYFGDLEDIDPETQDYNEISVPDDERQLYAIGQKGIILSITRKLIINDDLATVKRLVSRLGRASRRTHAKFVWNLLTSNPTCIDGTNLFTSGHGNLTTDAMSYASVTAAYLALAGMKEKGTNEPLGTLDDGNVKPTLVYHINEMVTGEKIVNEPEYFSSNDLTTKTPNPMKGKISGAHISFLADTNKWWLLLPPTMFDFMEMGYLNGRQEPEMFLADSPQNEIVFKQDRIRYKIRHEYGGTVIDYRSAYQGGSDS